MREQLKVARGDLGAFASLVGRPLAPWQVESLRLERRTTVVVAPRQTGKSRSLALVALWHSFRNPGHRALIVSAGEAAATRLLAEVREVAATALLAGSVVDEQASIVRLTNGSEVRSLPASERQVRGWTVDLLLVDEAAMVEDDLLLGAALPTTAARPAARIVLASSPAGTSGAFFDYAMRGINGSEHVACFRWRLADASWVTPEVIASLRDGLSPQRAAAELDAEFVDQSGGDVLIERGWIDAAKLRSLPVDRDHRGVLAVDVARFGGDRTVALTNRGGRVRTAFEGRGWSTTKTAGRLAAAMSELPADFVPVVDDAGVGGGVTDQARVAGVVGLWPFIGAEAARRSDRYANTRAETHWRMREAFEAGLIDLDPDDRALAAQLAGLRYGHDARGRVLIESKQEMRRRGVPSPDRADALSMCFVSDAWRPGARVELGPLEGEVARAQAVLDGLDAAGRQRRRDARGPGATFEERLSDLADHQRAGALSARW